MLCSLQPAEDVLDDLLRLGGTTQVRAQQLTVLEVPINGSVDLGSGSLLVKELEHQSSAAEGGDRVGDALTLDVRGAAVARLADGEAFAHVGAGHQAERANQR